jgi:ACT domain-containing protein
MEDILLLPEGDSEPKSYSASDIRQSAQKDLMLEQLKKTPIVQVACEKTGISRASYYRWYKADKEFAKNADEAISEGSSLVNDMAESQLMAAIRDKNMSAIVFWLKHHHALYAPTMQIKHTIEDDTLTPEQEALVRNALNLAGTHNLNIINSKQNDDSNTNPTTGTSGHNDQGQENPNSDN